MGDPITNIAGAVGRQIERGIGDVGTGLHNVANWAGDAAQGAAKGLGAVGNVLGLLAGQRVHARGSEDHAGSAPQSPNHQGVSHAPNAGPAMRKYMSTPPRPYQENNLPSIPSTGVLPGPAGAGRKVQTSTVQGPSASDMANIAANAKAKK